MTAGVRWLSVGPGSGYGDASEAYLTGLAAAGVPVTWSPLGWPSSSWGASYGPVAGEDLGGAMHRELANRPIEHDTVVVCSTPVWHERLADEASGRLLAAYTTWETDRLPTERVAVLNHYDRVLVPSQFNAAVFEASGITAPVIVVPHIAQPVQPARGRSEPLPGRRFVFYLIATWTTRKAILDTVAAFLATFTVADDVVLMIHTTPEDQVASTRRARSGRPEPPPEQASWFTLATALAGRDRAPEIVLSTRGLTRAEVNALHAGGDCFVSLSRGEGWGLGAFDAAAHGNPVIATGWGGTPEFLPADYPYLVEYDLVPTVTEVADAWWSPLPGEHWAKARIAHAATLLRYVFDHRDEAGAWGRLLQSNVIAAFAEADVTGRLLDALDPRRELPRNRSATGDPSSAPRSDPPAPGATT